MCSMVSESAIWGGGLGRGVRSASPDREVYIIGHTGDVVLKKKTVGLVEQVELSPGGVE